MRTTRVLNANVDAGSLSQAVGVLHDFRSRGIRVPADVSLIAYDDMPLAGYLNPPLDTVAMPLEEMGRTAVRALVAQVSGEPPIDIVVPTLPRLVLRGSTTATRESGQPSRRRSSSPGQRVKPGARWRLP